MTRLLTGAAGFIGFHTSLRLLARGEKVVGIDDLDDYYDVRLKQARLETLKAHPGFTFHRIDIADREAMGEMIGKHRDVTGIVHLAAQPGVRYSLVNPYAYTHSNIDGHLVVLELARGLPKLEHLVYASSSSVYGGNVKLPFSVDDRVDDPISLYAATKKANELMSRCYSHLFGIPATGLRFFTVYGPWGRPDMSAFLFTKAIFENKPIRVFNHGDMRRDFTFIDDIVSGIVAVIDNPPSGEAPHRIYNIGNNRSEKLTRFIEVIEKACGKKAEIVFEPMQPGDIKETYADIEAIRRDVGYRPTTGIEVGVPKFVAWYRSFHNL